MKTLYPISMTGGANSVDLRFEQEYYRRSERTFIGETPTFRFIYLNDLLL